VAVCDRLPEPHRPSATRWPRESRRAPGRSLRFHCAWPPNRCSAAKHIAAAKSVGYQTQPVCGFEGIRREAKGPNSRPNSATVRSISQVEGRVRRLAPVLFDQERRIKRLAGLRHTIRPSQRRHRAAVKVRPSKESCGCARKTGSHRRSRKVRAKTVTSPGGRRPACLFK